MKLHHKSGKENSAGKKKKISSVHLASQEMGTEGGTEEQKRRTISFSSSLSLDWFSWNLKLHPKPSCKAGEDNNSAVTSH